MSTLLLRELLEAGLEVGLYCPDNPVHLSAMLRNRPGLRISLRESGWRWSRWSSNSPTTALAAGTASRMWAYALLGLRLVRNFPDGDLDALEHAVRLLVGELRVGGADLAELARSEAVRCFSTGAVVPRFVEVFRTARSVTGQAATRQRVLGGQSDEVTNAR
jgi:hypothetical protein